jgi:hypothetical protein
LTQNSSVCADQISKNVVQHACRIPTYVCR